MIRILIHMIMLDLIHFTEQELPRRQLFLFIIKYDLLEEN